VSTKYWIGVASRDHVSTGVKGGFCQLGHGKLSAVRRLSLDDWIVYYSPRTQLNGGEPLQSFTAIGRIADREPYLFDMGNGFVPARRNVAFVEAREAPIKPLIAKLDFIKNKRNWAYPFRFGILSIAENDFRLIAQAMGVTLAE
jgi:hypothetical protein